MTTFSNPAEQPDVESAAFSEVGDAVHHLFLVHQSLDPRLVAGRKERVVTAIAKWLTVKDDTAIGKWGRFASQFRIRHVEGDVNLLKELFIRAALTPVGSMEKISDDSIEQGHDASDVPSAEDAAQRVKDVFGGTI